MVHANRRQIFCLQKDDFDSVFLTKSFFSSFAVDLCHGRVSDRDVWVISRGIARTVRVAQLSTQTHPRFGSFDGGPCACPTSSTGPVVVEVL